MAAQHDYKCSRCDAPKKREELVVKKVAFLEMGAGGKTLRSRVVEWLCPTCVVGDEHWRKPANPGYGPTADSASPVLTPIAGDASISGTGTEGA